MDSPRVTCEATKHDAGKRRFDLLPANALAQVADVYTYGAEKYDTHNWRKGMDWSRVFSAVQRHLWAFWSGTDNDPESGLPHLAHAVFGCFTLLEYMKSKQERDDRAFDANSVSEYSTITKSTQKGRK